MLTLNADGTLANADWTKQAWDLPTDKREFLDLLRHLRMTVADFKQLPVYQANLDKIPWLRSLKDDEG